MGFLNFMKRSNAAPEADAEVEDEKPVREAAGATSIDEEGYRKLTGGTDRDFDIISHEHMLRLSVYLHRSNPIANRLIELPLAYLLSEGINLKVEDDEAQAWIDKFWEDPINSMDIKLPKKVRELSLYGEQCWPAFVNEMTGHVRLGYLDPCDISEVVMDPDNAEQPIGVITKRNSKGEYRKYKVIINGPEDVFTKRTQAIRESFKDGDCFYFKINDLSNSSRGTSDLLHVADWLEELNDALFTVLKRWSTHGSTFYDVLLKGASQEECERRSREFVMPQYDHARFRNESEEWNATSLNMDGSHNDANARLFRNHILGGMTYPEHWFGGGGDVNRAVGAEMHEPTFKIFAMRQATLGYILCEVGKYVVRMRYERIMGSEIDFGDLTEFMPVVEFPEMTAKDTTKYAAALQQVASAVIILIDSGKLTSETGLEFISAMASRLGVEFDAAEELEKARTEMTEDKRREMEDDLLNGSGDNIDRRKVEEDAN